MNPLRLLRQYLLSSFASQTRSSTMVMHQYVAASLGLLSLAAIAGAGVGVGSGVGMMAMAMAEEEAKQVRNHASPCHLAASTLLAMGSMLRVDDLLWSCQVVAVRS